jgi:hypothetical protein
VLFPASLTRSREDAKKNKKEEKTAFLWFFFFGSFRVFAASREIPLLSTQHSALSTTQYIAQRQDPM